MLTCATWREDRFHWALLRSSTGFAKRWATPPGAHVLSRPWLAGATGEQTIPKNASALPNRKLMLQPPNQGLHRCCDARTYGLETFTSHSDCGVHQPSHFGLPILH